MYLTKRLIFPYSRGLINHTALAVMIINQLIALFFSGKLRIERQVNRFWCILFEHTYSYLLPIKKKMNDQLEITYRGTSQYLNVRDVLYIKSDNVYVEIFTDGHRYIQRKFLGQISHELPEQFVRVHRSYLVNMDHVSELNKNFALIRGQKIPVSRKFKAEEV